jgi:hypothetical protein
LRATWLPRRPSSSNSPPIPKPPGSAPSSRPSKAIVAGSRDRTLAEAPELHYSMAAEILILLDELEKAGK